MEKLPLPKLALSCLHDDFFHYSLKSLEQWEHEVSRPEMAKWILSRVNNHFSYSGSGCEGYDAITIRTHGGGRSRPSWADRIGKKYQWIAMFQLAARLNDHIAPRRAKWELEPPPRQPILIRQRHFDPTIPFTVVDDSPYQTTPSWWLEWEPSFGRQDDLDDQEWILSDSDLPSLCDQATPREMSSQNWRTLLAFPHWSEPEATEDRTSRRQVWFHIRAYLVDANEVGRLARSLYGRNFYGRWMPESPDLLRGFVGEYPWGGVYDRIDEEHEELPYQPVEMTLCGEWEYDPTVPRSVFTMVPSPVFFEHANLSWDGLDGFRNEAGTTVFRDPSMTLAGPSAFLADAEQLRELLRSENKKLIWTMLGEKLVLGHALERPGTRCTFSQVAHIGPGGHIITSKLSIFP